MAKRTKTDGEGEARPVGASVKTTERARMLAEAIAGLTGRTIGATVEAAIEEHAQTLSKRPDAIGAALGAFLKRGGPASAAPDVFPERGALGKAPEDLRRAVRLRDRERARK